LNKVVRTKASAEATPPGTADPKEAEPDTPGTPTDEPETKTDGEILEEIQDRPHPFN
jgi:hypothetical protein